MPTLCQALRSQPCSLQPQSCSQGVLIPEEIRSLLKTLVPALLSPPYCCSCHQRWATTHTRIVPPKIRPPGPLTSTPPQLLTPLVHPIYESDTPLSLHNDAVFFFFLINLFIYFIFGCVGSSLLHMQAFSSCGKRGLLFVAVCRLLIAVTSLVAEHGL